MRARQAVRSLAQEFDPPPGDLPVWAAADIPESHVDLVNAYARAEGWPSQQTALDEQREILTYLLGRHRSSAEHARRVETSYTQDQTVPASIIVTWGATLLVLALIRPSPGSLRKNRQVVTACPSRTGRRPSVTRQ